ncbi:pyrroline-5-carboxylate reductase [Furfurilactobacillus sp. WILCCON 0119]|uniref:pyrroline-5-carboxylate reductase n=1 Tax=Furfurilactobacillus entadae TaxID=2922307 RepID=UPI0035EDBAE9
MRLGFIGVGGMAQAIINGLLDADALAPADIIVHSAHPAHYQQFAETTGVQTAATNAEVAKNSDFVVLAVTPIMAADVLKEIREQLNSGQKVLISIVAGLSLQKMEELAGFDLPILRTLPNVNVAIGAGMTAVAANENLTGAKLADAKGLFDAVGSTAALAERDFSTFSALAGSSPAFIYFFIDALSRAGVKHGLTKAEATRIAAAVTEGSAKMVLQSSENPFGLIDQVSSPGGSTVAGLLAMEEAGLMTAVVKGIDATIKRDQE